MQLHVSEVLSDCNKSFFAMRTLHAHGLSDNCIYRIFNSVFLSKLLYACSAWSGFTSYEDKLRLEAFLNKAKKFNYYASNDLTFALHCRKADQRLFKSIIRVRGGGLGPPPIFT